MPCPSIALSVLIADTCIPPSHFLHNQELGVRLHSRPSGSNLGFRVAWALWASVRWWLCVVDPHDKNVAGSDEEPFAA